MRLPESQRLNKAQPWGCGASDSPILRVGLGTPTVGSAGPGNAPQRPDFSESPAPHPRHPPKAVRGPSYTVPPPNPLSHATAPLLSLEYSASSRSHPLTKARGAEVPEPPCHFSSRAASTASILTQRPARFKFAHFRLQPGRSAHPRPLGGGTRGDAGGGKDLERRGCGPVGCCPGVARLASLPFVSLPT